MKKAFVVSDIHGCYDQFFNVLDNWDKEMQLVILGDLIDRGDKSLEVVQYVMELKNTYGDKVVCLKGNHEDMFLSFLDSPFEYGELFFANGGARTAFSFVDDEYLMFKSYEERARQIKEKKKEVEFLRNLDLYFEFGEVLFVHAGINPLLKDWQFTSEADFMWTRNMIYHKNETGLTIVFGHTPTQMIHENTDNNDIWVSKDKSYICIDGGCVFKGQMNAIVINEDGKILDQYAVKK